MVAASGRPSPYRADPYTTLRDSNLAPPDGSDMEILCSLDDHSRYAITVTAHRRVTGRIVVDTFSKALETQGIPASTLTDEGSRVGKAPDIHLAAAGRDRSTCRTLSHTNIGPAVADLALRHPTKPGSGPRTGRIAGGHRGPPAGAHGPTPRAAQDAVIHLCPRLAVDYV
jgi:hypothetical protein